MRKPLALLVLIVCSVFQLNAQDIIPTNVGEVKITPILHGSLVIEFDEMTVFVDPYGGAEKYAGFSVPNLILITDIHGDHLHKPTLDGLNTEKTEFIVPEAVLDQLGPIEAFKKNILNNGETTTFNSIGIKAIPMYNLPEDGESRHTKGRGNGYILTMGGKNFYISGDTEDIPEMRQLENIDVAFVCMNLPYTMSIEQAADAVSDFKPGVVYPYHFRGQGGLADVEKFKKLVKADAETVEVRLRNWYPEN